MIIFSFGFFFVTIPDSCANDESEYCWQKLTQAGMAGAIKIVVSISIGNTYIYMVELFPSVFRGIGVSITNIVGRIGNILAPIISNYLI